MSTRGRWVSSDKRKFGVKDCSLFSHLQTLFVLSLESEDLLCWPEVLLTDIIRGSTEDDRSGGTRNGDTQGAE